MRNDFQMWPEIVFIDGTYKLTNKDMTVMIILVEDGNGRGQVAGIAFLSTEERDILEWMLTEFKKDHKESCRKIKAFMTDKDLTERDALKELFPGVPTYICAFHAIKIFERVLKNSGMKLKAEEQVTALEILIKLVKAQTEKDYDDLYLEFNMTCSAELIKYFNVNWHCIREDWSKYSVIKNNFGNETNNKLESVNGKIKQVVDKFSPLSIAVKDFFEWYDSHKTESHIRTAQQFLRKPILSVHASSSEQKYIEKLTKYASNLVLKELKSSTKIVFTDIDEVSKICQLDKIQTSTTLCQCSTNISLKLPCRHILAARSHFKLPLYDECLFHERWSKDKLLTGTTSCIVSANNNASEKSTFSVVVKKKTKKTPQSITEKRKIVQTKVSKLVNIVSMSCGSEFQRKLKMIDNLIEKCSNNTTSEIAETENDEKIETSLQNLTIENKVNDSSDDKCTEIDLTEIKTPAKIKIKGRPSGFLKTTASGKKKKKIKEI